MFVREGVNLGGKEFSLEIGRMAKQANGAVVKRENEKRSTRRASSAFNPAASIAGLASLRPDWQALPADTITPRVSR